MHVTTTNMWSSWNNCELKIYGWKRSLMTVESMLQIAWLWLIVYRTYHDMKWTFGVFWWHCVTHFLRNYSRNFKPATETRVSCKTSVSCKFCFLYTTTKYTKKFFFFSLEKGIMKFKPHLIGHCNIYIFQILVSFFQIWLKLWHFRVDQSLTENSYHI